MKCFIIAMESEAQPIISHMAVEKDYKKHNKHIVEGNLFGEQVAVVVTNVGKVNAGIGAQYAIDCLNADTIINIGVAGGLHNQLQVANIYSICEAVQYDFDLVQLNGTSMGTLNEFESPYIPCTTVEGFKKMRLGSGDRFNDNKEDYHLLTDELKADIRDMEGAAIAQVCYHANIPFYSFKAISDLAGSGSTTEQFVENLGKCANALYENMKKMMEAIHG